MPMLAWRRLWKEYAVELGHIFTQDIKKSFFFQNLTRFGACEAKFDSFEKIVF